METKYWAIVKGETVDWFRTPLALYQNNEANFLQPRFLDPWLWSFLILVHGDLIPSCHVSSLFSEVMNRKVTILRGSLL
jgi:hypothetical protein